MVVHFEIFLKRIYGFRDSLYGMGLFKKKILLPQTATKALAGSGGNNEPIGM